VKVSVVGGGLFGSLAAIELARTGAEVDLYERHPDLLLGASRANQGRLHHGYHYPRSPATVAACLRGAVKFADRFSTVINDTARHHYLVAQGGLTSGQQFLDFCHREGLAYQLADRSLVQPTVEVAVTVPESFIALPELRRVLKKEIRSAGVDVHCDTEVDPRELSGLVVDATYGQYTTSPLRFEVTEIALIGLGAQYRGMSFVVMDGPFISLDPLGELHMLYDVTHSVHHANVGTAPEIPAHLVGLVDRGVIRTRHSHVDEMQLTARRYLKGIGMPTYHGSLFTVRAVLPDVDATDERPTLVERTGDLITVLSGKLDTAIEAARKVVSLLQETVPA